MKKALIIPLLFFTLNAFSQDTIYFASDWEETEKTSAEYYRVLTKLDSLWKIEDYYIDNRLQMTGMLNKPFKSARHGEFIWYNPKGVIVQKGKYKNGKQNGEIIFYFDDGKTKTIENYQNGIFHGLMRSYYPDGQIESNGEYVNGNLHGVLEFWFPNGQLKIHSEFDNGKKVGEWRYFDEYGNLTYNPVYKKQYEILKNKLLFDIPNNEWFRNKYIRKNNVSWHSFQRNPIKNENGVDILPNISFLIEEKVDLDDVILYSMEKRQKMSFEVDSTFIHDSGRLKIKNAIAYSGYTIYEDGSRHNVLIVHALIDKKGIQIVMDITSDLYEEYGNEFWLALDNIYLKE
ncbi:toxin-antitoxin system YwqK family antitoxin [Marinifilum flexuosum]|uniref:MORN repeat protein n=1 Tax=Marinifilum flexuosum TaxID=1117708 RepID=A0A419WN96_9BACT|nr:toxin-antitoxin system YwqK family antitoxin [Marinifilum flexuosum]RKD96874.1 MORN repeat protein [Marinifilum flexuosum]